MVGGVGGDVALIRPFEFERFGAEVARERFFFLLFRQKFLVNGVERPPVGLGGIAIGLLLVVVFLVVIIIVFVIGVIITVVSVQRIGVMVR